LENNSDRHSAAFLSRDDEVVKISFTTAISLRKKAVIKPIKQQHPSDLHFPNQVDLHIDLAQRGVGGDDS
jgi:hypothetical protein